MTDDLDSSNIVVLPPLPKTMARERKKNESWLQYQELTYSEQCDVIQEYLGSMALPEKVYPPYFNKNVKSNFRKRIKGYCLNSNGKL